MTEDGIDPRLATDVTELRVPPNDRPGEISPLEPTTTNSLPSTGAKPARGWHGATLRNQSRYSRRDWNVYFYILDKHKAREALIVDVVEHSPAWQAGVRSGCWVLEMGGVSLDAFRPEGGAVAGAVVPIRWFNPDDQAVLTAEIELAESPKPKKKARTTGRAYILPAASSGVPLNRTERPKWLGRLAKSTLSPVAVKLGLLICNNLARDDGWCRGFTYAQLAEKIHSSRPTTIRAINELCRAGYLVKRPGARSRIANDYCPTFPKAGDL